MKEKESLDFTVYTREGSVSCVHWIFCSGEDPVAGICEDVNEH